MEFDCYSLSQFLTYTQSPNMPYISVYGDEALREHTGYRELLRKMNLPLQGE